VLPNSTISLPPRASLNGGEYKIIPYDREVYALTALKKGKYQLGSAKFNVKGNLLSYFSPTLKKSLKKTIEVLDIPFPRPKNFSGEIGDYKIKILLDPKNAMVGIPIPFSVQISGQ